MTPGIFPAAKPMAIAALALLAASSVNAQDAGSRSTREFVQASGQSDSFEILEGTSALAQSTNPQVRSFALQMIDDHTALRQSMTDATTRAGLTPPPQGPSSDQSSLLAALQSARGADFDRLYFRHQALAHRAALVVVQAYVMNGDQPAVRDAARSALLKIQAHLSMADQIAGAVGQQ